MRCPTTFLLSATRVCVHRVFSAFVALLLFLPCAALAATFTPFDELGEVQVSIEDDHSGGSRERYDLIVTEGERTGAFELVFNGGAAAGIRTGDLARVLGEMTVHPDGHSVVFVSDYEPQIQSLVSIAGYNGARTSIAIRVSFADGAPSASANDIKQLMWEGSDNLDAWFQESSFGQISFPRDVDGIGNTRVVDVTITASVNGCDPHGWAAEADALVQGQGITLANYQHRMYYLAANDCAWAGLGNLGCTFTCRAWSNNYGSHNSTTADVMFHELGHNVGFYHARTDADNNGTTDCEYCDVSDPMGYGGIGRRHFTAARKAQQGWIPPEDTALVEVNGTYDLFTSDRPMAGASPAAPSGAKQLLTIPYPGSDTKFYALALRTVQGNFSDNLGASYQNRITVHWFDLMSSYTYYITSLASGESFTDGTVTVQHSAFATNNSTVTITTGGTAGPSPTATPSPEPTPQDGPSIGEIAGKMTMRSTAAPIRLVIKNAAGTTVLTKLFKRSGRYRVSVSPGLHSLKAYRVARSRSLKISSKRATAVAGSTVTVNFSL